MEAFRKFLKGWIGKVLLFIFLAPLALFGISSYFTSSADESTVASIDDVVVTQTELNQSVSQLDQQISPQLGANQTVNTAAITQIALDSLVDQTVQRLQGFKLGLGMSDAQISAMLRQDPSLTNPDGSFSAVSFETLLRNNGMSKAALFDRIRRDSAQQGLSSMIQLTSFTSADNLDRFNQLTQTPREVWIKRYDWQSYADQVIPSEAELKAYFESHASDYVSAETVDVDYLVLKLSDFRQSGVDTAALEQAYEARVNQIKSQVSRTASHILFEGEDALSQAQQVKQQLDSGLDFAEAASQYSADIASKQSGGNLGVITSGVMPSEFEQALSSLDKGEVSEPVTTEYGVHLIKLTQLSTPQIPSFAQLKDELSSELMMSEAQNAFQSRINEINELAASSDSLIEIANQPDLQIETLSGYPRANSLSALPDSIKSPQVAQAIFDPYNLESQAISVGINAWPDKVVWVQPIKYSPAKEQTFEQAKAAVKADLVKQGALKLAKQAAKEQLAQVQQSGSANQAQFISLGQITRSNSQLEPQVLSAVFSAQFADDSSTALVELPDVITALYIKQLAKPELPTDKQQLSALQQYLSRNIGQLQLSDYTAYAKQQYEIEINPKALTE